MDGSFLVKQLALGYPMWPCKNAEKWRLQLAKRVVNGVFIFWGLLSMALSENTIPLKAKGWSSFSSKICFGVIPHQTNLRSVTLHPDFAVDCHPSNRLECLPCSACARRILQGQSWRNVRVPQERGRQTFGAFKNWLDLRQMLQETILFHEELLGCPPSFCWKNILWDRMHRSGTKAGPPYADLWIQL